MNLQECWENKIIHGGDITYSDGRCLFLKENWCRKSYTVDEVLTFKETLKRYGEEGTAIEVLGSVIDLENGNVAYCGEGSMGNEGFVAYADKKGKLIWLVFLDFSNPFWSIKIEGANIKATTELECEFTIPLESPEKLSCINCNKWEREHAEALEKTRNL